MVRRSLTIHMMVLVDNCCWLIHDFAAEVSPQRRQSCPSRRAGSRPSIRSAGITEFAVDQVACSCHVAFDASANSLLTVDLVIFGARFSPCLRASALRAPPRGSGKERGVRPCRQAPKNNELATLALSGPARPSLEVPAFRCFFVYLMVPAAVRRAIRLLNLEK